MVKANYKKIQRPSKNCCNASSFNCNSCNGSDQLTVVDVGNVLRTILDPKVDVLCVHKQ